MRSPLERTRARCRGLAVVLAIVGASLIPAASTRAANNLNEYQVKAALIFNFAKFVTWPAGSFTSASEPFVIGVLGSDPFGATLDATFDGKTLGGRSVVIRRWRRLSDLGPCQVLFVSSTEQEHLGTILDTVHGRPTLTVADLDNFVAGGGMIGLVVHEAHIGFEINPTEAGKSHLAISSRLLSLARVSGARAER